MAHSQLVLAALLCSCLKHTAVPLCLAARCRVAAVSRIAFSQHSPSRRRTPQNLLHQLIWRVGTMLQRVPRAPGGGGSLRCEKSWWGTAFGSAVPPGCTT